MGCGDGASGEALRATDGAPPWLVWRASVRELGTSPGCAATGRGGWATPQPPRSDHVLERIAEAVVRPSDAPWRRRVSAVRSALAVTECGYGGRMFIHGTTATRSRWFDRCLGSHSRCPKLPARRLQLQWQRSTVSRPSTRRSCREMPKKPKPLGSLWKTSTHTSDSGCPHRCGSQRPRRIEWQNWKRVADKWLDGTAQLAFGMVRRRRRVDVCHVCVTDVDCVRLALSAAGIAAATHAMLIIYSFTTVALGVSAGQDFTSWTTLPALMSACVSAAACARAAAPVESNHTTAGDHGGISENKQEAWQRKCLH